jgi:hypothetical protein
LGLITAINAGGPGACEFPFRTDQQGSKRMTRF